MIHDILCDDTYHKIEAMNHDDISSSQQTISLYWRCGCGKIQLELTTKPWLVTNCHCHSCVAPSRYLDEKYTTQTQHVSAISDGGAALAFFHPNDIKFATATSKDDDEPLVFLSCLKVGEDGKPVRKYCKSCGTLFGIVKSQLCAVNRISLYMDKEGTQRYKPQSTSITNTMKKYAFDPDKVPEPSYYMAPLSICLKFVNAYFNPFGQRADEELLKKFEVDDSAATVVPITWE